MDLKPHENNPKQVIANFDARDLRVLSAAYREKLRKVLLEEGLEAITDRDLALSEAEDEDPTEDQPIPRAWLEEMAATLQKFSESTPEEVEVMIRKTSQPNYKNKDITERIRLGREAGRLALEMDDNDEVRQFVQALGEAEIDETRARDLGTNEATGR